VLIDCIRKLWQGVVDDIRFTNVFDWLGLRGGQDYVRRTPCVHLWNMIEILWNGQITLCCFDLIEGFINMGNAGEIEIGDYWQNDPGLNTARQDHMRCDFSHLKICATCSAAEYQTNQYATEDTVI
jgi:hypothetical protein